MRFHNVLLVAAAALSGCAHESFVGRPELTLVQNGDLPAPAQSDRIFTGRPFVIGPLDRVTIDVYGVPELSRTVQVDSSGIISLPLAGNLAAAGKTPIQLADAVAAQLRRYVREPQVTVNTETVNQTITVDGQVNEAGQYPVMGDLTLMRAIAQAKGVSQYADQNYVVVFRRVNNQQLAALYDLRAIRQGIYKDPPVYANDIVLVGEDNARRVFQNVIQGVAILAGPLIAIVK